MSKQEELVQILRRQIIGGLHVGSLRPGTRLESIRELSLKHNVDHRVAAKAYDQLEAEKLVEVRGRSGVFIAAATEADTVDQRDRWVSDVLNSAREAGITFAEVHALVTRASLHGLRCLCLESTTDHLVALSSELASDFGLAITPYRFEAGADGEPNSEIIHEILQATSKVDFVVTTSFHASWLRPHIEKAGKELISVTVNRAIVQNLKDEMAKGRLRIVIADPAFLERSTHYLDSNFVARLEIAFARDVKDKDLSDMPTLYTRAARRQLGLSEFHLFSANVPFIAPDSAKQICALIVRLANQKT